MADRIPTMHPAVFSYWEPPDDEGYGLYHTKAPPHGAKCGGCGSCAHCPAPYPEDPMHNHSHGWWREELFIEDKEIMIPPDVEEWIITMDTYVSGNDGERMYLSNINVSIHPVLKGREVDPNDPPSVVARAPTYAEILKKFEEYISVAVRRERARVML